MATYLIDWHVEVTAASFQDAARQALAMQQDPANEATMLRVVNTQGRHLFFDAATLGPEESDVPPVCPGCGRDNADSDRLDFICGACALLNTKDVDKRSGISGNVVLSR